MKRNVIAAAASTAVTLTTLFGPLTALAEGASEDEKYQVNYSSRAELLEIVDKAGEAEDAAQEELNKVRAERAAAYTKRENLEKELAELQNRKVELEAQLKVATNPAAKASAQAALNAAEAELKNLQENERVVQDQLIHTYMDDAIANVEKLEKQIQDAQFEKIGQENIRSAREAEIEHTHQLLADTHVKEELESSQKLKDAAQKDLDAVNAVYRKSKEQYDALEKATNDAFEAMDAARIANTDSLHAWEDAVAADNEAQKALLEAEAMLDMTKFQLEHPVTLDEIRTDPEKQLEEADERIAEAQEHEAELQKTAEVSRKSAEEAKEKLDVLTRAQETAWSEMVEARTASEKAHEDYQNLLVEKKQIEGSVETHQAEIHELEDEIASLDNLIAIREKEWNDYKQEYADIQKKNELIHSKDKLEIELREVDTQIALGSLGFFQEIQATETYKYFTDAFHANTSRYSGQNGRLSTNAASIYYKETRMGREGDATSLENMKKAVEMIGEGNILRTGDTGPGGTSRNLNALMVSPSLMAMAQVATNAGIRAENHTGLFLETGENLSWNYQNPYVGWFDDERESFIKNGWQSVDHDHPNGKVPTGHYENIIDPAYDVTGFAVNQYSKYGGAHAGNGHGQLFMSSSQAELRESGSQLMTYAEFRKKFEDYYEKTVGRKKEIEDQLAEILYLEEVSLEEEKIALNNVNSVKERLDKRIQEKKDAQAEIQKLKDEIAKTDEKIAEQDKKIATAKEVQEAASADYHAKDEEVNRVYHEHLDQQIAYNQAQSIYETDQSRVDNVVKIQENWKDYQNLIEAGEYEQAYATRITNVQTEHERVKERLARKEQEKQEAEIRRDAAREANRENNEKYLKAIADHETAYEAMMDAAPEHLIAEENQKAAQSIYDIAAERVHRAEVFLHDQNAIIDNAQKDADEASRRIKEIENNLTTYEASLERHGDERDDWQSVHDHNLLRLASAYYDENGNLVSSDPNGDRYLSDHVKELTTAQRTLLEKIQTDYQAATTEAENNLQAAQDLFHDFSDEKVAELNADLDETKTQIGAKTEEFNRSQTSLTGLDQAVTEAEKKYDAARDYNSYVKHLRYDPDETRFVTKDGVSKGSIILNNYTEEPPKDIWMDIQEVSDAPAYALEGNPEYRVYDIQLKNDKGEIYEAKGPQTRFGIQIEIPKGLEGRDLEVYLVRENNSRTESGSVSFEKLTTGYLYGSNLLRWDSDELGRFLIVDRGPGTHGIAARFDAVDDSGNNHGTILIRGSIGDIPEGVHADLGEKTQHDDYSVKGAKGYKVYTIQLLDKEGKVYEVEGDNVSYSIQLPMPGDYENRTVEVHGVRNAGIQVQDGSVAAPELDKMDVSYNYETKLLSWDSPQLGEFVIADMSGAPAGGSGEGGGQGNGQQSSGSGTQEKKSNTSTTNNSKNTTTTKSANTGLQLRFGLWFAGLFASTGAAAAVLKKMRKDE